MNAYYLAQSIRHNINEASPDHWLDLEILRQLNFVQRRAAIKLALASENWLVKKSDALTPSSSQITLPSDCSKPIYLETVSEGYPIEFSFSVRDRRTTRMPATSLGLGIADAYPMQKVIEVNQESFTEPVYLWYQRRIPDLIFGTATTGGAASLTFPSGMAPHIEADYYNEVGIEVVDGTGAYANTTVSDYAGSTFVTTLAAGTFSSDSVFGTISELPPEAEPFLVLSATMLCLAKPSAAIDPKYFEYFKSEQVDTRKDWEEWCASRTSGSRRTRITEPF